MHDVDAPGCTAFGLAEELMPGAGAWHSHQKHQLLYASHGTIRLEVASAAWLLPPQRSGWIRAGTPHRTSCERPASLRTVYFDPRLCAGPDADCRVFATTPLAREMILHAMQWGRARAKDETADRFFLALASLCDGWGGDPLPLHLPRAKTPELERAMTWALAHLNCGLDDVARAVGVSGKTLARRFADECQLTWRGFLLTARMIRATELLARPRARVAQTAFAVGFESPAAFARAFRSVTGESPEAYRRRVSDSGKPLSD